MGWRRSPTGQRRATQAIKRCERDGLSARENRARTRAQLYGNRSGGAPESGPIRGRCGADDLAPVAIDYELDPLPHLTGEADSSRHRVGSLSVGRQNTDVLRADGERHSRPFDEPARYGRYLDDPTPDIEMARVEHLGLQQIALANEAGDKTIGRASIDIGR